MIFNFFITFFSFSFQHQKPGIRKGNNPLELTGNAREYNEPLRTVSNHSKA